VIAVAFLAALLIALVIAVVFKTPLKKAPWVFYALAVVLDVLFVVKGELGLPAILNSTVFLLMQKCVLAEALFVVVMFIGVFGDKSRVRSYLMPIRAELSLLACFLCVGHIVSYLQSYLVRFLSISLNTTSMTAVLLALVLTILLIVLGVTSFNGIKKRMSTSRWKRVQWFAYPFFLLTYVHAMCFMLPSALFGGKAAQINVVVYSVVFLLYLATRSAAAFRKKKVPRKLGAVKG
jgi:DMSO/TMAO reductase YedYZ heme-binding membrane subunit